ncbi:hypothetical protein [Flavobacterium sp. FlaQc-47]|uniref:hypothetical protein n=1 Tax=Flavobacterium sp. FlaQc-47 TaxID=3374180 RepID=UPI0037565BD3
MKNIYIVIVSLILFFACTKQKKEKITTNIKKERIETKESALMPKDYCSSNSLEMQTSEYQGIKFYTENTLRGSGVVQLLLNNNTNF